MAVIRRSKANQYIVKIEKLIREQVDNGATCNLTISTDIKDGGIARVRKTISDELRL